MISTCFRGKPIVLALPVLACAAALAFPPGPASAEENLPILVVTPLRFPAALDRSGSAVTVIEREEIETWGSRHIADVLRGSPGVDITEQGGSGGISYIALRGSIADHTLVLIDGLRAGDPSSTGGAFDLSLLSTQDIERIEILRGPQSALYGSDAMGGVVNIVTRKGKGKPRTVFRIEGGSYGTLSSSLSTSGSTDKVSYAFALQGFRTDGFSAFAYRIGRLTSQLTRPLERDPAAKTGASARVSYRPAPGVEIEFGLRHYTSTFRFDNPGAFFFNSRDTLVNKGRQSTALAFARISNIMLDGRLKNSLTLFGNQTDRFNRIEAGCFDMATFAFPDCENRFRSQRSGAEYQGDLKLGGFGALVFGARHETERASGTERWLTPLSPSMPTFSASQTTNAIFALHQISIGRFDLSLGGRVDTVDNKNSFPTWRATAAYRISETGTKFRVSAGTGAKAPTLYQRFSIYGTPNLQPEKTFGYEVGVDQSLWNGRAKLSVTAFDSRYTNLIGFDFSLNGGLGGFFNVNRAHIQGVEASAQLNLIPQILTMRAAYTYLRTQDRTTGRPLLRRPKHKGYLSAAYTGIAKTQIEGRVTLIGSRFDSQNDFPYSRVRLSPYAKVDGRIDYQLRDNVTLFLRMENITNARYEEIRDYGAAGRSFFAGAKIVW